MRSVKNKAVLRQLEKLQHFLYEKSYQEARQTLGSENRKILNYSRKFEASLPPLFEQIDLGTLEEHIAQRKLIMVGDFHSHKQAQRAFLRLLRHTHESRPDQPIIVALEMFDLSMRPISKHLLTVR